IATLATGTWPSQHGIVADSWYDRSIRNSVAASDEALLAPTLAAQVAAGNRNRANIVALNEIHGAIFAGTPDARVFSMDEKGQFYTQSDSPEWLTTFNTGRTLESLHDQKWLALNAKPDAPTLRTLNFRPQRPNEFLTLYRSSP